MRRPPSIKICGMTRAEDVEKAVELGADYVGVIVWPGSARFVPPLRAGALTAAAKVQKNGRVAKSVGVFVDPTPAELKFAQDAARFDLLQFHGNESPDLVTLLGGTPFIKALRPRSESDLEDLDEWATMPGFQGFLVDAAVPGQFGGTGRKADWELAKKVRARWPLFLSGGLSPDNVADAIGQVQPWAVDVASGVEATPGIKDHVKLERFFNAVKKS